MLMVVIDSELVISQKDHNNIHLVSWSLHQYSIGPGKCVGLFRPSKNVPQSRSNLSIVFGAINPYQLLPCAEIVDANT